MIAIILVVLLALLVVCALFVWWRYDMDLVDIATSNDARCACCPGCTRPQGKAVP